MFEKEWKDSLSSNSEREILLGLSIPISPIICWKAAFKFSSRGLRGFVSFGDSLSICFADNVTLSPLSLFIFPLAKELSNESFSIEVIEELGFGEVLSLSSLFAVRKWVS